MFFGGECNWVYLAMIFKEGGNVFLLDELINDIDVNIFWVLEDVLDNFVGCVLVILYDCWFIDCLAMYIFFFDYDEELVFFEGNYF